MKIGQYCQRQRCRHAELKQFRQAFASRGFVSDSWAFLLHIKVAMEILTLTTARIVYSFSVIVNPYQSIFKVTQVTSFTQWAHAYCRWNVLFNLLYAVDITKSAECYTGCWVKQTFMECLLYINYVILLNPSMQDILQEMTSVVMPWR